MDKAVWTAPALCLPEVEQSPPSERVFWLRELSWRLETCLLPLHLDLAIAIELALDGVGFLNPESPSLEPSVDLTDCVALALSLLRFLP